MHQPRDAERAHVGTTHPEPLRQAHREHAHIHRMGRGVLVVTAQLEQRQHDVLVAVHRDAQGAHDGLGFPERQGALAAQLPMDPPHRLRFVAQRKADGRRGNLLGLAPVVAFQADGAEAHAAGPHLAGFAGVDGPQRQPRQDLIEELLELRTRGGRVELQPLHADRRKPRAPLPATQLAQRHPSVDDLVRQERVDRLRLLLE